MISKTTEDRTIRRALSILERRMASKGGEFMSSPETVGHYLVLRFAERKAEVFVVVFLDARHSLIECREMFHGTIDGASVYTREVVRAVIETNAAAVVIGHNHPSGNPEPSSADQAITLRVARALALIDVRVLDHIVVGGARYVSMAERGMM